MHDLETKERFIELRAQGKRLRDIAKDLAVPRSTLGEWNREFGKTIAETQQFEIEAALQELGADKIARAAALGRNFKKISEELDEEKSPWRAVQFTQLLLQIDRQLNKAEIPIQSISNASDGNRS